MTKGVAIPIGRDKLGFVVGKLPIWSVNSGRVWDYDPRRTEGEAVDLAG
jgi:hypothetical protein